MFILCARPGSSDHTLPSAVLNRPGLTVANLVLDPMASTGDDTSGSHVRCPRQFFVPAYASDPPVSIAANGMNVQKREPTDAVSWFVLFVLCVGGNEAL